MEIDIERITRKSEEQIRKALFTEMLNEPFSKKLNYSKNKVTEFIDILGLENVFVATSGGKDSACLSDLCKKLFPNIKHIMFDTGLEYKATIELAKSQGAILIPPKTSWIIYCQNKGFPVGSKQISKRIHDLNSGAKSCVITLFSKNYGLPNKWLHFLDPYFVDFPISHTCCNEFKKNPSKRMKMNPIIGTRIVESRQRKSAWKKSGCNSYTLDYKHGISRPISLWKNDEIESYIDSENVKLSEVYTQYKQKRTGCVNCPYGAHCNDDNRFDLLRKLEPKRYDYFMKTELRKILALSNVEICSDLEYMMEKNQVQDEVKRWRKQVQGDDNYLSWKCNVASTLYSKEELFEAINHISKHPLKYEIKEIINQINVSDERKENYNFHIGGTVQ